MGKDPCAVPLEAYEPLLAAAPFKAECSRVIISHNIIKIIPPAIITRDVFNGVMLSVCGSDDVLEQNKGCGSRLY